MKPSPNVISAIINVIFNAEIFLSTITLEYTHKHAHKHTRIHVIRDKPIHNIALFEKKK